MSYCHAYSYYLVKCHQHFHKIDNGGHQLSYVLVLIIMASEREEFSFISKLCKVWSYEHSCFQGVYISRFSKKS